MAFGGNERTDDGRGRERKEGIDAAARRGVSLDFTLLSTLQTIRLGHCRVVYNGVIATSACLGLLADEGREDSFTLFYKPFFLQEHVIIFLTPAEVP